MPKITAEIIEPADLTRREVQVFKLLCEGHPDKSIASILAISIKTVEAHLDHIYSKIGVQHQQLNARAASIATAVARGMVHLSVKSLCLLLIASAMIQTDDMIRAPRIRARVQVMRLKKGD